MAARRSGPGLDGNKIEPKVPRKKTAKKAARSVKKRTAKRAARKIRPKKA